MDPPRVNVADRLAAVAAQMPDAIAVASDYGRGIATCTFRDLNEDATTIARGLLDLGVKPGQRIVLLVKPSVEFVKLVFAMLRAGAVIVLVDPGMGRKHLINCLAASEPDGFLAVSRAQAMRVLFGNRFPRAQHNVTIGRRWFWRGPTYEQILERGRGSQSDLPITRAGDPAAIIFTSGSTGPPKGVLYTHRMFDAQAAEIQRAYDLQPGGIDLACFALFGLFNSAMGVTTVFPDMDFSRPATVDPRKLLTAANEWQVTQAFASPAVWDKLSRHCEQTGERIPTLRQIFSCGAPVPATVLKRTLAMVHPDAEMHTPYGATEALPIATIDAQEVLSETAAKTNQGAGVCVGRKFDSIEWKIIRITDDSIADIAQAEELPPNEIGELIVRGPQVSPEYVVALQPRALRGGKREASNCISTETGPRPKAETAGANAFAKIAVGNLIWHRMGDVGYLDDKQRFWYCGRNSQRVETAGGTLFTECCEAVFNQHPSVRRAALVGCGPRGEQTPCIVVEPSDPKLAEPGKEYLQLCDELSVLAGGYKHTECIQDFVLVDSMPVDVRHNSKINREQLIQAASEAIHFDRRLEFEHCGEKWVIKGLGAPPESELAAKTTETSADRVLEILNRSRADN